MSENTPNVYKKTWWEHCLILSLRRSWAIQRIKIWGLKVPTLFLVGNISGLMKPIGGVLCRDQVFAFIRPPKTIKVFFSPVYYMVHGKSRCRTGSKGDDRTIFLLLLLVFSRWQVHFWSWMVKSGTTWYRAESRYNLSVFLIHAHYSFSTLKICISFFLALLRWGNCWVW